MTRRPARPQLVVWMEHAVRLDVVTAQQAARNWLRSRGRLL